jgi:DNA-binding PadR family transcriptional regulator
MSVLRVSVRSGGRRCTDVHERRRHQAKHQHLCTTTARWLLTALVTECLVALVSVPRTLLGLLELTPSHGYDLKRAYDARFGADRPLKPGQVYATLGRLERDGLVVIAGTERDGGPDRTTYEVTADGVRDLERWYVEPEGPGLYLQPVLFTKVVLALQSGRDAADLLERQRAEHRQVMRVLTAEKATAELDRMLALDFALFHLEADLRWLDHTTARLDRLRATVALEATQ